jgi:hypothetical protein
MKEFSIPMVLFDLLPVIFFMAGFLTIAADMRRKISLPAGILLRLQDRNGEAGRKKMPQHCRSLSRATGFP